MLGAVWVLVIMDYVVTYILVVGWGIQELNPLMVWMFEIPLWAGLLIRAVMATGIVAVSYYIKTKCWKNYARLKALITLYMAFLWTWHLIGIGRL